MKMKVKIKKTRRTEKGEHTGTAHELAALRQCQLQRGLKYSKKREAVAAYFLDADRHFTVEQLYREVKKVKPKIGYSTVYRTLKLLADCGIAAVHHFEKDEARFEPTHKEQHHDHLVCEQCGRIVEFTHPGIEQFQQEVAKRHQFVVRNHELQIYGVCKECQRKKKRS